jgi:hypothetical protein
MSDSGKKTNTKKSTRKATGKGSRKPRDGTEKKRKQKKAVPAFVIYGQENRPRLEKDRPDLAGNTMELGKALGLEWATLTSEQKAPYEKKSADKLAAATAPKPKKERVPKAPKEKKARAPSKKASTKGKSTKGKSTKKAASKKSTSSKSSTSKKRSSSTKKNKGTTKRKNKKSASSASASESEVSDVSQSASESEVKPKAKRTKKAATATKKKSASKKRSSSTKSTSRSSKSSKSSTAKSSRKSTSNKKKAAANKKKAAKKNNKSGKKASAKRSNKGGRSKKVSASSASGSSAASESEQKQQRRRRKKQRKPRAMSPFMFFVAKVRDQILQENPLLTFAETGKEMGARWKKLSTDERKPFNELHEADKARIKAEIAAKDAEDERLGRKKKYVNTPYIIWFSETRPQLQRDNPSFGFNELGHIVSFWFDVCCNAYKSTHTHTIYTQAGEIWGKMTEDEKRPYVERSDAEKKRVKEEHEAKMAALKKAELEVAAATVSSSSSITATA